MIYRVLVDNTWTIFLVPPGISPKRLVLDLHRKGILPTEVLRRLESLSQPAPRVDFDGDEILLRLAARPIDEKRRLVGAGFGVLASIMDERGVKSPPVQNPRVRFYFTDLGWRRAGRFVSGPRAADGARRKGRSPQERAIVRGCLSRRPSARSSARALASQPDGTAARARANLKPAGVEGGDSQRCESSECRRRTSRNWLAAGVGGPGTHFGVRGLSHRQQRSVR